MGIIGKELIAAAAFDPQEGGLPAAATMKLFVSVADGEQDRCLDTKGTLNLSLNRLNPTFLVLCTGEAEAQVVVPVARRVVVAIG